MKNGKILLNGIINENPTFVLFLGMCPVLATSSSLYSAVGMSVCVFIVLLLSNVLISLIGKITPNEIRIPVYIIIIATLVSIISMVVEAFASGIYSTLGAYLQLIVVNCIILGRAEAFASKNGPGKAALDAIGISVGFLIAMVVVAFFREVIGTGKIVLKDLSGNEFYTLKIFSEKYAIATFNQATGAFLVLGICVAAFTAIRTGITNASASRKKEREAVSLKKDVAENTQKIGG